MAEALRLPSLYGAGSARPTTSYYRELSNRQWSQVKGFESTPWLRECYDTLTELTRLEPNWDSYQSAPISENAIGGARLLLSNLEMEELPKPQILPVADGGVGIHWRIADRDLEIEINPTGVCSFVKTMIHQECEPESGDINNIRGAQLLIDWLLERR